MNWFNLKIKFEEAIGFQNGRSDLGSGLHLVSSKFFLQHSESDMSDFVQFKNVIWLLSNSERLQAADWTSQSV